MEQLRLDQYPFPALVCREGLVVEQNEKAALLPSLTVNGALSEELQLPEEAGIWEGSVPLGGAFYRLRASQVEQGMLLCLEEEGQQALDQGQLDAALYQLRRLMSDLLREVGPSIRREDVPLTREDREQFSKSYYQMLRLLDHLDLIRDAASPSGLDAAMGQLDLASLCHRLALESDGVLAQMGVQVAYEGPELGLYTTGDGELLRSAILEILSNSTRQCAGGGVITMKLSQRAGRASILLQDDGPAPTDRQRRQLGARTILPGIPRPGEGAGLGLNTANAILRRHGGMLFVRLDGTTPKVVLTLPLRRNGDLSLRSPRPERNAGMSQVIIALSDVLPGTLIYPDWEE